MALPLREAFEQHKYKPGEGICLIPGESQEFLSFTTPMGQVSGVTTSLLFQFRKWGYVRYKVDESIWVSPVLKPYYDLVVSQREQLQASIKAGLTSISQAISDFELVWHDLRKYKEFLDHFEKLEKGRKLMKEKKEERIFNEANSTLKSIFIDQVDVHTGETVALKLIAPRWPTVIVDFMRLKDEDIDPKKIADDYKISEAEGVVLATKNKLYLEWRDKTFFPAVKERYQTLKGLVEARKKSIEEYKNMLKPTIARYKMIVDALEKPEVRKGILISTAMPYAQALSGDSVTIWAWKPFAPSEKYKITRESLDLIPALEVGFNGKEVEELKRAEELKKAGKINERGEVYCLPVEPSIDRIVRYYKTEVEKTYGVTLTTVDLFNARHMLVEQYRYALSGLSGVEPWVWSPYFVFINVPLSRTVVRTPAGVELEDLEIEHLHSALYTQNFIIVRCLELIAKEKQMENYISTLLGEYGVSGEKLVSIGEMVKEEFPTVYGLDVEKKLEEERRMTSLEKVKSLKIRRMEFIDKIRDSIGKIFQQIGFPVQIFRAFGPYEFTIQQQIAKGYMAAGEGPGREFAKVRDFLKTKFGVPGFKVVW
jgi:hypothetical protein